MKLFPRYTWIEWSLLAAMAAAIVIIPMVLPDSLATGQFAAFFRPGALGTAPATMRFTAIFVLFGSFAMNAFFWQDAGSMDEGYSGWLGLFIAGPIVAIMTYYGHGLFVLLLTATGCTYCAPWSILRIFLRRRFLSTGKA